MFTLAESVKYRYDIITESCPNKEIFKDKCHEFKKNTFRCCIITFYLLFDMAWKWPLIALLGIFVLDTYIVISVTYTGSTCKELTVIFIGSLLGMIICIMWFFMAIGHRKCKNARIRIKDPRIRGFNKTCIYHCDDNHRVHCDLVDSESSSNNNSCIEETMIEDSDSSITPSNSDHDGNQIDEIIVIENG